MAALSVVPEPTAPPTGLAAFARMRAVAADAEALAPVDPTGARASLADLRDLVSEMAFGAAPGRVAGLLRIVDTLDADLEAGGVRSITGLVRQVDRLVRTARRA